MPTTMTFEAATLADALTKASRIAPVKGAAFDRAAGYLIETNPAASEVILKATDIDSTYLQHVPAVSGTGDGARWRIPSRIFTDLITGLPMSESSQVQVIDRGDNWIRVSAGRTKAKLAMLDPESFPLVPEFPMDHMVTAHDMAVKVEQVAWSTDPGSQVLQGVHIDGKRLVGTTQHTIAAVPCEVTVDEPITVPLATLASLLKGGSNVQVQAVGRKLHIALDGETQITAPILEGAYPKIDAVMRDDFTCSTKVHKATFLDALGRMLALIKTERAPVLEVELNGDGLVKMITFDMEVPEVGRMQDGLDVAGEFDGIHKLYFNPRLISDAFSNSRADVVVFSWGHADPDRAWKLPIRVSDDRGYTAYVMPMRGKNDEV